MTSERKENVELLTKGEKVRDAVVANGAPNIATDPREPPDGGFRAYTVALASFFTNGLLFGIINCSSILYTELKKIQGEDAAVKISFVGSLTIGTTFALSPVSGILTSFLGLRMTAVIGGSIATAATLLSSFIVNNVEALCFTYGILFGLGASLAYTPSLAILGLYFKKNLGIVNGVVTVGSCVFTVFMPTLMEFMIQNYGLEWMFRLLSLFTFGIVFCGLMFKPVPVVVINKPLKSNNSVKTLLKTIGSVQMWKISKYRYWAISMPVALFGYFVPYIHIKEFMLTNFQDVNHNLPLQVMAASSAVGRISFGLVADRTEVDKVLLQQISFYVIGTVTIILPFVPSFSYVIVIAMIMGLFEGGFIALIGPIAFELVGPAYAAQAIGCTLGIASIPLSIGPSIAGYLHLVYGSYTLAFVLAGLSPLVGATLMFLIRCTKRGNTRTPKTNTNGHAINREADLERAPAIPANGQVTKQDDRRG